MLRVLIISTYIIFYFFHGFSTQAATKTNGVCTPNVAFSLDTIPPASLTVKKSILKKIGDFLKFRSRADARWVARVKKVIDTLGLVASISAERDSILRIHMLANSLTDSSGVYYNTLLTLLNKIEKETAAQNGNSPPSADTGDTGGVSTMASDMQALADKIALRLSKTDQPDTASPSKVTYLAALSRIENSRVFTDTVGDTLRRFRVTPKKRLQIYGFHNATLNATYAGYRFDHLSTLIYNGMIIQPDGKIDRNGWDTARVIKDAEAAGISILANFVMSDRKKIISFLNSDSARSNFIQSALPLLKRYNTAGGANIVFDGLPPQEAGNFVNFITELRNSRGFGDSLYRLIVTLPVTDRFHCFDLSALDKLADNFIINFSTDKQHPPVGNGPVFPLTGGQENSIGTRISALTIAGINRSKLIIAIPYVGAAWKVSQATKTGYFLHYLAYKDIRAKTGPGWESSVDPVTGAIAMDSLVAGGRGGDSLYRIWTDNENVLGKKYDYAVNSQLNGIAINALGDDAGYGELWDELAYKLLAPDTIPMRYALLPIPPKPGFLGRLFDRLYLYWYIVQNPCERCFDNIQDSVISVKVYRYLDELNVDSLIIARERKTKNLHIHSRFQFINEEMRDITIYITLGLLFLSLLTGIAYFFKIKTMGDQWKWKRSMGISLSVMVVLLVLFGFTWSFCDKRIGFFAAVDKNLEESRYNGIAVTVNRERSIESTHTGAFMTNTAYCDEALVKGKCVDIPLLTFLFIVASGMLVGYGVNWLYHTVVFNEDNP